MADDKITRELAARLIEANRQGSAEQAAQRRQQKAKDEAERRKKDRP